MKDLDAKALDLEIVSLLAHFVPECNRLRIILCSRVFGSDKWFYALLQLG